MKAHRLLSPLLQGLSRKGGDVGKVVAVAFVGNTPYLGWSSTHKTSPKYERRYPDGVLAHGRHAEDHLLDQLRHQTTNLARVKVFVARMRKDGTLGNAKPCLSCQRYMADAGLHAQNIMHTTTSGAWSKLRRWEHT